MDRQELYIIHESADRYEREFIAVDPETNTPWHCWTDGGNMWGNRSMEITWQQVESLDPARFAGVNGQNWRAYL